MARSKEVTKAINEIESELDLFGVNNNCALWDYIRMNIWYDLKESKSSVTTSSNTQIKDTKESDTNYSRISHDTFCNFIKYNPLSINSKDVLFHGFARRTVRDDGKKWCPYCDPIVEELDLSWGFLENPRLSPAHRESGELHDKPTQTSGIKYTDYFTLSKPLLNKLNVPEGVFELFIDNVDDRIYTAINQLYTMFDSNLNIENTVSLFALSRKIEKYMYKKILDRVKPSVVIAVNRGQKLALIEASNELNIPTILLQQGTIYNSHIGFSYPENANVRTFPDYLFTWGEFWNDLVELPISDDNIRTVGWPFFEIEKSKYQSSTEKNIILIISQPQIGGQLADYALDLARKQEDYSIIFKPHPNIGDLATNVYPQLSESPVSVIHDEPLYKLFSEARVQVGYSSTAIFEGLGFGLDTYIVEGSDKDHVKKLLNKREVTSVSSSDEICAGIKEKNHNKASINTELFFKQNSLPNTKKELINIAEQYQD